MQLTESCVVNVETLSRMSGSSVLLLLLAASLSICITQGAPLSNGTLTTCTGTSARLPQSECTAWLSIWDHFSLGYAAKRSCNGGRQDPCDSPTCAICSFDSDGTAHISMIDLGDRGLTGSVPDFSGLPHLNYLMLAANSLTGKCVHPGA